MNGNDENPSQCREVCTHSHLASCCKHPEVSLGLETQLSLHKLLCKALSKITAKGGTATSECEARRAYPAASGSGTEQQHALPSHSRCWRCSCPVSPHQGMNCYSFTPPAALPPLQAGLELPHGYRVCSLTSC